MDWFTGIDDETGMALLALQNLVAHGCKRVDAARAAGATWGVEVPYLLYLDKEVTRTMVDLCEWCGYPLCVDRRHDPDGCGL